jgi:SAM-dependent methyltransferase
MSAGFESYAPELAASISGFDPANFSVLVEAESSNFWFRSRNRLIQQAVADHFPDARSMLEIGCGTGYVLSGLAATFPGMRLVGSEALVEGLSFAATRVPRSTLLQMDARHIPYTAEFDLIGAFDVIEHIEEDEMVLAEIHRALRPGGGALFTVPQHPSLWSRQDELAGHVRRYGRGELEAKLRSAGFRILRSTSFVTLLLPLLYASRRRMSGPADDGSGQEELNPPRAINSLLYGLMSLERAFLRIGINLPVGGSRLVIAQREPAASTH